MDYCVLYVQIIHPVARKARTHLQLLMHDHCGMNEDNGGNQPPSEDD
jgi:hypothetical protein